jgi:uncharacterized membrane protein YccC
MSRLTPFRKALRHWLAHHHPQLRLCLRVTTSAVLALAVAHLLNLPLALWTVLTAVLLTQISVGGSLKATADYLASTLGGAIYAAAIGTLVPHTDEIALLAALAVAVAPPALLAAMSPRFKAAPFTAVMVFFGPTITHAGPIASAVERVTEVAVGAVVGLVVSLLVLPARAHGLVVEAAARMLSLIAQSLPQLFAGFFASLDEAALHRIQDPLGEAFARLNAIAPEVRHERITPFSAAPDPGPLLRTLLRLRHDLVMLGRAAIVPLPEPLAPRLKAPIEHVAETAAEYLRSTSAALLERLPPPGLDRFESALEGYSGEVAAIRREGLTRGWSNDSVERLFALGFSLEQMHRNFIDLSRCVADFAGDGPA